MKSQNQKNAAPPNMPDPAPSTFWLLVASLVALLIVPIGFLVLVFAVGWQALLVVGTALIIAIAILVAHDYISSARHRASVSRRTLDE